jgi:hypothetical protein
MEYETRQEDGASSEQTLLRTLVQVGYFLSNNKRWWLPFFLLPLLLIILLAFLPSTGAVPFVYTLY